MSILFLDEFGKRGPKGKNAGNQIIPYCGRLNLQGTAEQIIPLGYTYHIKLYTNPEDIVSFCAPKSLIITKLLANIRTHIFNNTFNVKIQVWNNALSATPNVLFETETIEVTSMGEIDFTPVTTQHEVSTGDYISVCLVRLSGTPNTSNISIRCGMEIKL